MVGGEQGYGLGALKSFLAWMYWCLVMSELLLALLALIEDEICLY